MMKYSQGSRRAPRALLALVLLACALVLPTLAGCSGAASKLDPPAAAVDSLLRLREARSTDASAYAEYVGVPELASQLADASKAETSTGSPIPTWEPPYLSAEGTSTASVVVVWGDRSKYPGWPMATMFSMRLADGKWAAMDAQSIETTADVPKKKSD